ncbi:MAG TPA: hypothetical protein VHA33_00705 [Candidatus Angelobacter sp.]|nr:hypothetical protein [Candidatus Angelobacter sp.]
MIKLAAGCVLGMLWCVASALAQNAQGTFITFQVPESTLTDALSINTAGAIAGYYVDANGMFHGFMRDAQGTISSFDPSGSAGTFPTSINDSGVIMGYHFDTNGLPHGFVRDPQGTINSFDPPRSTYTVPHSINGAGVIVGEYFEPNDANGVHHHGFVRDPQGTFTMFDFPGGTETIGGQGINATGAITGNFYDANRVLHGFVRDPQGTFTSFDPLGSTLTNAESINTAGTITGYYVDTSRVFHGFVRDVQGTITSFDPPGSVSTNAGSINTAGDITAWYFDGVWHGYLRDAQGAIISFDVPRSAGTFPRSINDNGVITGVFADADGVRRSSFVGCQVNSCSEIVDSVPDLLDGASVTTNPDILTTRGRVVEGVAADGVTEVVLRIPAQQVGQTISLAISSDQIPSISTDEDGGLLDINQQSGQLQSSITVTAASTSSGQNTAFAVYRAPRDYPKMGFAPNSSQRTISIMIDGSPLTVKILRPPVVLIHGLWDDPSSWRSFELRNGLDAPSFFMRTVNNALPVQVTSSTPSYPFAIFPQPQTNSLGFHQGALLARAQMENFIQEFKQFNHVAAVQADVVAHSMGGNIARTLPLLHAFSRNGNFLQGPVHKLITIGTPHLGSPLAQHLFESSNSCPRVILAATGNYSFESVTTPRGTFNGGVFDLQGDGKGNGLSFSLSQMQNPSRHMIPTAFIVGAMGSAQLDALNTEPLIRLICTDVAAQEMLPTSPLTDLLTPVGWPTLMGGPSDAIVPVSSEVNMNESAQSALFPAVHSSRAIGFIGLGFGPPAELDPAARNSTITLFDEVFKLLNTPANDATRFVPLP